MIQDKQSKLDEVIEALQERHGTDIVQRLGDYQPPKAVPTGIELLDELLGGGLLPGRITGLQGSGTSGRVTLAYLILAHLQGDVSVYVDMNDKFESAKAVRCGVDLERILIVRPGDEIIEMLGVLFSLRVPFILLDENDAQVATQLPDFTIKQLAASGSLLLTLPPTRQAPARAGTRLMVDREEWIRDRTDVNIIGCRSRIIAIEGKGIRFGQHITLDLITEGK